MINYVTLTSQGQITIPAKVRERMGITKADKLYARFDEQNEEWVVQKAPDILNFKGAFKDKAHKDKTLEEILALEERAIQEGNLERYKRYLNQE